MAYDKYLKTGPYNFGFPSKPDFVEHFPYQDGLLISLWDTSQSDNNTSQHPGEGLVLPIDAHPRTIYNLDGEPWRPRIQMYDAPFGLQKVDSFTLHSPTTGNASYIRGQAGNPLFDDSNPMRYFKTDQPTGRREGRGQRYDDQGPQGERHLREDPDRHPGGHPVGQGTRPAARRAAGRRSSSGPSPRSVPLGCRPERVPRRLTPGAPRHPGRRGPATR